MSKHQTVHRNLLTVLVVLVVCVSSLQSCHRSASQEPVSHSSKPAETQVKADEHLMKLSADGASPQAISLSDQDVTDESEREGEPEKLREPEPEPEPEPPYPLDALSRETSPRGRVKCPKLPLISYRGDHIKYHRPVTVHPAFKERLARFELLVEEVALEVYGRAPREIKHLGTYNCRRIGGYPNMLSEHSFGNGIDVASFVFSRLKKGDTLPAGVPRSLRRAFTVDMLKHWNAKRTAKGLHRRFLHTLGRRLIESEIFRVLLGPSFPGHKNHFHLDCAPYELISIFER